MKEIYLGIKDANIFSYSHFYLYWKKRHLIGRLFAQELKRNRGKIKVLDTGCGWGTDLFYLNSLYGSPGELSLVGLDLSEENIKFCNEAKNARGITNMSFLKGNVEELEFADESFDVVICSELLEHLPDQGRAIGQMKRVLKQGGSLIITTPNKANYFLKVAFFFRSLGLWKKKDDAPVDNCEAPFGEGFGHISTRSLSELILLFRKSDFKIESIRRGATI
jgi:ubiquinone/menaquinone biosynthesis C-methylase UbiE